MGLDKKIVLVGNGSSVLNCENGQLIDSFNTVVRFNSYKIRSFECNIGIKTDIWFTVNRAHIKKACSYQNVIVHSWEWDHSKDLLYQDIKNMQDLFELHKKDKQIADLYALIDTLQTNLRTATNYLNEEDKNKVVNVQSYKWCMNWRQGDELN